MTTGSDPQALEQAIADLQSPEATTRFHATARLRELGGPQAVSALVPALEDPTAQVRAAAALALGGLAAPEAVPSLVQHLRHDDTEGIRAMCAASLWLIGDRRAVPGLIEALNDPSQQVVGAVCRALGELGDPAAVEPLHSLLFHLSWHVRFQACWALDKLGATDATVLAALEQLAQEPEAADHNVYWHEHAMAADNR